MVHVSEEDIQRDFFTYLQWVEAGETVVIVCAGHPVAAVKLIVSRAKTPRPFGVCAGECTVPDDVDASCPEDILYAFAGT